MTLIRPVQPGDETAWRALWAEYCQFYNAAVPAHVTDRLWARFFDPAAQTGCLIAEERGAPAGFATYILHPYTWGVNPVCYLEDLFVSPAARGRDVGHSLISRLVELARSEGWDRVYWHTETGNARARRLYDRFAPADDFVRYRLPIAPGEPQA